MLAIQFNLLFLTSIIFSLSSALCTSLDDTEKIVNENVKLHDTGKRDDSNQMLQGLDEINENSRKLAKANNELSLRLYKHLASKSLENIFFSPMSLSIAFGMLSLGTKGETAKELRQTFGFEAAHLPEELVHATFQHYLTQILQSRDSDAYLLTSANAALLDNSLEVHSSYEKEMKDYYQATVKNVDFPNEKRKVVTEINEWVKEKTNGKIEKLLDDLDSSTIFVLLNAVYFKGTWKTQFETKKTELQKFYNNGLTSEAKNVPMMKLKTKFQYTKNSELDVEVIEMPYKGENISMFILLPNKRDGLGALEQNLSLEKLKAIQSQLFPNKVTLTLPKFKIEYSNEMSEDLKALGAKSIFSPGADFSRMTEVKNVHVSQVLHKAVVEVNEEGSEAAAVTGIISNRMKPLFDPPVMTVDHPFLFTIVDKRNNMILFIGRVINL